MIFGWHIGDRSKAYLGSCLAQR